LERERLVRVGVLKHHQAVRASDDCGPG
jgi:hypothetical protein